MYMEFFRNEKELHNKVTDLHLGSHGSIKSVSGVIGSNEKDLKKLLGFLPKNSNELRDISYKNDISKKMFNSVVKKSFEYLRSVAEHYLIAANNFYDSVEFHKFEVKEKDENRRRNHDALIATINPWLRSLVNSGEKIDFLLNVLDKNNRETYADFGLALALDIYTKNKNKSDFIDK